MVRLKLNNSINPKYYSMVNVSKYKDIEYYTVTANEKNKKANIKFEKYGENNIPYLNIKVQNDELPNNIYDIVIDAGHGGNDTGEKSGSITEANLTLDYAKKLKEKLQSQGYKVKLTRDDSNSKLYTYTNMYDENGRISIACESNAKLMISLHVNNGSAGTKGFELYCPCKSNFKFAKELVQNISSYTDIASSNNNLYKVEDGIYVRNFRNADIEGANLSAKKNGYSPYNITLDTPYLYTIREVGGIATNAYVDGRNKNYSTNKYYNSNQGIECYQLELGYIKTDLQNITNQIDEYTTAISEAIYDWFNMEV